MYSGINTYAKNCQRSEKRNEMQASHTQSLSSVYPVIKSGTGHAMRRRTLYQTTKQLTRRKRHFREAGTANAAIPTRFQGMEAGRPITLISCNALASTQVFCQRTRQ